MILMYHKVHPNAPTMWWVDVNNFYRQMCELRYTNVVYLDDYNPDDKNNFVISFDGVYKNILDYAVPILQKFKYPFEVFITSNYLGSDNAFDKSEPSTQFVSQKELIELTKVGGRLQWHTCSHLNLRKLTDKKLIKNELHVPKKLRQIDYSGFNWIAYPHGEFNEIVLEEVKKSFVGGVSCHQGDDKNRLCFNRITVTNKSTFKKASVTVIIASYNYGCYLIEAIESVLRQTYPVDEIIVADDCSTDNTNDIGLHYADLYKNFVRYYRNEKNMGIVDNFNKAINMSTSEYVCILGADNRFCSNYIEETITVLDADTKLAIAYTDFALFGERARLVWDTFPINYKGMIKDNYYVINFPEYNEDSINKLHDKKNFIHGSSLFRKSAFLEVGGYRGENGMPEDYNLFYRMLTSGWSAKRVPFPILEYRQHSLDQANIKLRSLVELNHYKKLNRELSDLLSEKDSQLLNHVALVNEKDAELAKYIFLVNQKNNEVSETLHLLQTIYSSRSWRITSPLRFVGRIIRGDYYHIRLKLSRKARQVMRLIPTGMNTFIRRLHKNIYNFKTNIFTSPANAKAINEIVKHRCETTLSKELKSFLISLNSSDFPKIDISVVTFNSQRWVHGFVESLLGLEYPKTKLSIWFVDNSSTDSTLVTIEKEIKRLQKAGLSSHVITRPNNGYGAGNNAGIEMGNSPFCLVTNIDLIFEPDSLAYIAKIATSDDEKIATWEFRQKPYEHPKYYDPVTGLTNWNSHACVLIRRSALLAIGGYDERLFMYGEDVEISYRLRRSGYLLRYCPLAIVWHFSYENVETIKPEQYKGSTYANLYIRLKYGQTLDILAIPFLSMGLLFTPSAFPDSKRMILNNILRLIVESTRLIKQRCSSDHFFSFCGFDYDMIRDGAFFKCLQPSIEQPLVSVITRTYQGRDLYLRQALISVLQQTYANIEHIIVEDGGESHASLVAQTNKIIGKKILYFPLEKVGRSAAGNVGLRAANGKFCLFLDDDDLLFADHIEVLIQAIQENPNSVASYSLSWEVVTDAKDFYTGYYIEKEHFVNPLCYQKFDFKKLSIFNYIPIQSILFHHSLFDERGGFEEDMNALEDWNLWIRYAWNSNFIHVPKVTSLHRIPYHINDISKRQKMLDKVYSTALIRAKEKIIEMESNVK